MARNTTIKWSQKQERVTLVFHAPTAVLVECEQGEAELRTSAWTAEGDLLFSVSFQLYGAIDTANISVCSGGRGGPVVTLCKIPDGTEADGGPWPRLTRAAIVEGCCIGRDWDRWCFEDDEDEEPEEQERDTGAPPLDFGKMFDVTLDNPGQGYQELSQDDDEGCDDEGCDDDDCEDCAEEEDCVEEEEGHLDDDMSTEDITEVPEVPKAVEEVVEDEAVEEEEAVEEVEEAVEEVEEEEAVEEVVEEEVVEV
jgi:hypothetical protein